MAVDQDKLMEFLGRFVGDLGATMAAGSVVVGDRLGLYKALAGKAQTAQELADATGTDPRYVEEWLRGQAAGGYVGFDAAGGTYSLSEEQAFALTDPDGPVYMPGAFELALGSLKAVPRITEAVRTGAGVGWHEHDNDVFTGCERFFRPGYLANLMPSWLPALDGVEEKLRAGRDRRRHRLRARLVDGADGQRLPGVHLRRLGLPRRLDRRRRGSARARPASATGSPSRSPRRRPSPAGRTTSSRRSTRSTTWATRWVRPPTCARRWRRTAPG